jgi:tetratricopeptide (TPR) repeat protein
LGDALLDRGQTEKALAHLRRAIQLNPRYAEPHYCLGNFWKANGRLNEAIDSFQQAIKLDPNFTSAHYNLGNILKGMGRFDEAIEHYQQTFRIDPTHANSQGALGETFGILGRFREAHAAALRFLELLPQGDTRRPLALGLVKQCEQLLLLEPRLPAILQGKEKPANPDEGLQFAEICRIKKKYVAAVRLFAAAFKVAESLVEDPQTGRRYNAACVAALVGCGDDEEARKLSEEERARWRKEARTWLRADLAAWKRLFDRDPSTIHAAVQQTLKWWQADPDLAGLRDSEALGKLPPSERKECLALWNEVQVLWRRAQSAEPE